MIVLLNDGIWFWNVSITQDELHLFNNNFYLEIKCMQLNNERILLKIILYVF